MTCMYFGPGFLQMVTGLICFLDVGVLLCRGNQLLTGSNTRWLRLWEVESVQGVKPQGKVSSVEDRFVAHFLMILLVSYINSNLFF